MKEDFKRYISINKYLIILFAILTAVLLSPVHGADNDKLNEQSGEEQKEIINPADEQKNSPARQINAISAGNKFRYKVKWGGVAVASSELMVMETAEVREQLTYHVINHVWTEGVIAVFFKVNSTVESFIDVNNLFSWRYVKNIREGRYRDNLVVDFDQINHIAIRQDTTFTIPENIQDPLSILWYFRKLNIQEENIMNFSYCDGKKNGIIQIHVLKKEKISTPAGEFVTDVIEFSVGKEDRVYLKKEVRLKVWFSDDEMRMPVFIQAKAPVGIVTGILVETNFQNQVRDEENK